MRNIVSTIQIKLFKLEILKSFRILFRPWVYAWSNIYLLQRDSYTKKKFNLVQFNIKLTHRIKYIVFSFLILLPFAFFLYTCSKQPTSPQTITLSGRVVLEDTTDYSGVKVMLFKPVELDTTLVRINRQYPNIGVQISQETEFDHREHTPLYTTLTDANGNWQIENVVAGAYNVVASKEGYGWRYRYKQTGSVGEIILKRKIQLSGIYQDNVVISEKSFVEVVENTTIMQGKTLTLGSGTYFYLKPGITLEINGDFNCNGIAGKMIQIFSEGANNNVKLRIKDTNSSQIQYVNFKGLSSGLYFAHGDGITISHSVLQNCDIAVEFFDCKNTLVINTLFKKNNVGVYSQASETEIFKKNIFYQENDGIRAINEQNSLIQNNLFENHFANAININPSSSPSSLGRYFHFNIFWNDFQRNQNHIRLGYFGWCVANNNNFLKATNYTVWTADIRGVDTLNFRSNYWNTTNPVEIAARIVDYNDDPGATSPRPVVDYSDFKTEVVGW